MRPPRYSRAGALALGLTTALTSTAAQAANAAVRVNVAAKPVHSALIELALQTNISLGGDLFACEGRSEPISGRMTLDDALRRMLARSGCTFKVVDAATVVVMPRAKPAMAPHHAPTPSPDVTSLALGEVVVTAPKSPELLGRTPYMISTFSGAALNRTRSSSLADLTGQVAGMTLTNLGPGRDKILLRGLSDGAFTGETQSTVALYLDDVPITYNAPDPDLRLSDLERVEIMRGPQGTLYGGGSIGGVVRLETRKPDLDAYGGSAMVGLSSTRRGGLNDEAEAVGNLPLIRGRVALRAVAYRERESGYLTNPTLGARRVNVSERDGARLALRMAVTPNWTLGAGLTHQSINNADTQYGLRRLGPFYRDNRLREPHDNDFDQGYATLTGEGGWGKVVASAARLAHSFDSRYDASSALPQYGAAPGLAAFDEAKAVDLAVAEITYSSPAGRRFHGLAGIFASTGETRLNTALTASPLTTRTPVYAEARTDQINETAVYGEASYDVTDTLSATVGLRFFEFRFNTESNVAQGAGARAFKGSGDATGVSPKIMLRYAPSPDLTVYAQFAEGYRPGGFNTSGQIGQVFDAPGAPQRRYGSDELLNYELGAKTRWLDDRLQVRAAVFYATWEAIQSDQYLADGLLYTANIGSGTNRGLEIEATLRASERLDLKAAGLVDDPEVTHQDSNFNARKDAGLPGVPKTSFSVAADYHRPLDAAWTLRLQGQAAYVGPSRLTFDADQSHAMGDYVAIRLTASLESARWTLDGYVDNPFDLTANSFTFGNPFRLAQDRQITPLRPRTVGMRLSRRF